MTFTSHLDSLLYLGVFFSYGNHKRNEFIANSGAERITSTLKLNHLDD